MKEKGVFKSVNESGRSLIRIYRGKNRIKKEFLSMGIM